jgi:hypothetical protein
VVDFDHTPFNDVAFVEVLERELVGRLEVLLGAHVIQDDLGREPLRRLLSGGCVGRGDLVDGFGQLLVSPYWAGPRGISRCAAAREGAGTYTGHADTELFDGRRGVNEASTPGGSDDQEILSIGPDRSAGARPQPAQPRTSYSFHAPGPIRPSAPWTPR